MLGAAWVRRVAGCWTGSSSPATTACSRGDLRDQRARIFGARTAARAASSRTSSWRCWARVFCGGFHDVQHVRVRIGASRRAGRVDRPAQRQGKHGRWVCWPLSLQVVYLGAGFGVGSGAGTPEDNVACSRAAYKGSSIVLRRGFCRQMWLLAWFSPFGTVFPRVIWPRSADRAVLMALPSFWGSESGAVLAS